MVHHVPRTGSLVCHYSRNERRIRPKRTMQQQESNHNRGRDSRYLDSLLIAPYSSSWMSKSTQLAGTGWVKCLSWWVGGRKPSEPSGLRTGPKVGCIECVRLLSNGLRVLIKRAPLASPPNHLLPSFYLEHRERSYPKAKAAIPVEYPTRLAETDRLHPP